MSVSSNNVPKINEILTKYNMGVLQPIKREESSEKFTANLNLKCSVYRNDQKNFKDLSILNYITNNNDNKYSSKASSSDTSTEKLNIESYVINKYDEHLNSNLSFISEFDLEAEENDFSDSFNSCDNEHSDIEEIEIKSRTTKNIFDNRSDADNEENKLQLEKEWNDICDSLLSNKISN